MQGGTTMSKIHQNFQKSSFNDSLNCFNSCNLFGIASCLALSGITPIPLKFQERVYPAISWKDFKVDSLDQDSLDQETLETLKRIFSQKGIVGIALKTGEVSNLLVIDVDDPEKFNEFYSLERLKEEAGYVIETKDEGHYHFGFLYDPDLNESKNFLAEAGFELKADGSLVNFYTVLPEFKYEPIKLEPLRPMPVELKEKILTLMARQKDPIQKGSPEDQEEKPRPEGLDPSQIIELASGVYQRGQRQYWVLYTAGYLRKLGFSFEEVKEALKEFLRSQGDEEIEMRLAGVEHTYQESLENVKGLSGLLELGLSDEAYLKLHNFKVKEEIGTPKFFTLYDLLTLKVKEPFWIIPNLLPEGFTILGGKPKVGKSWLALQIALTCVQLGKRVVYFALEDTKGRLQKRLKHLGIIDPEALKDLPILFSFELPKIGKGAIKEIRACIQEFKPDLIIIDPLAKIKPKTKGKDLFLEEYQALEVFKEFQREGVNILLVHHARKSQSEDPIDEILGSTGQTAVVDNILVLKRGRGSQTAVLHLIPRDFEGVDLGLRFENGWKLEGKAEEVMLGEGQKEVLEAIRALEAMGEKATIKAIAEFTGKSCGDVRFLLYKLSQKGLIERSQRGTYSLCKNKNIKSANNANNANNANMLTMLTNQPQPSFVSDVSGATNKVLTFLAQKNQGFGEFVSDVSDVSDVINCYPTPTSDPTPTPNDEKEEKEEMVFILMPDSGETVYTVYTNNQNDTDNLEEFFVIDKPCVRCGSQIWIVSKKILNKNYGVGTCYNCKHQELSSWNKEFVISEEEAKRLSSSKDEDIPF
jgi:hypothetical protein